MSALLFVCLVFITKIVASDYQTTSQYEASSNYKNYNQKNPRKLVTESLNDSPDGVAQSMNFTKNTTNITISNTVVQIIKEQDKNGTATKKPVTDKEEMETQSSQVEYSYPPYATYAVTENVIDIPDDRTPAGPIDTNYTHRPPILNLAKPTNKTETEKVTEANIKSKKNCLSILHIKAEFDDNKHEVHENKVVGFLKGIKEYIHGFHRGIANGFHSFFHKHQDMHAHGGRFERGAVDNAGRGVNNGFQNVDKNKYNVHRRDISLT